VREERADRRAWFTGVGGAPSTHGDHATGAFNTGGDKEFGAVSR
jgi:hypothetical protein